MPSLTLNDTQVDYQLRRSRRVRHMRLVVHQGGALTVTAPLFADTSHIESFIYAKARWILENISKFSKLPPVQNVASGRHMYLRHRADARAHIVARLAHWNTHYGFSWGRVSIKDHRSMWGSCSRRGNLNFNYRLFLLPPALADFVIVHELCHLKEHNHSVKFWDLVAQALPDWRESRRQLKSYSVR